VVESTIVTTKHLLLLEQLELASGHVVIERRLGRDERVVANSEHIRVKLPTRSHR